MLIHFFFFFPECIPSLDLDKMINGIKDCIASKFDFEATLTKQESEDVKEHATRKSTRVMVGRSSSVMEMKKPSDCVEVGDEAENDKELNETETKVSSGKVR